MCGICGFVGNVTDKETILGNMMDVIKHRGPDSEGKFCTDEAALGFRRLSIIDWRVDHSLCSMKQVI